MECPSCRQDLSRFEYIYRYCPLCGDPLPDEVTAGKGEGSDSIAWEEESREPFQEDLSGEEARPPFDVYWKEEVYEAKKSNTMEIDFRPARGLKNVSIRARFPSMGITAERETLPFAGKSSRVYFHFRPETAGKHIAGFFIVCRDAKDNPTVFETDDFTFRVEDYDGGEKHTTYNVGDIISAGEVFLGPKEKETPASGEKESPMVKLDVIYNDAETRRLRTEMRVTAMMAEAKELYQEGTALIEAIPHAPGAKARTTGTALDLLARARERFIQVRQESPDHEESLGYLEKIKEFLAGSSVREDTLVNVPHRKFDSCVLRVAPGEAGRNIFLFSKERILIGKDESNDIVMGDMGYISGTHALIHVTRSGEFRIRDVGTEGKGSKNGTYLNGKDARIEPNKDYSLYDGTIVNLGKSLGLFCRFLWGPGKGRPDYPAREECVTVTGEQTDTCFGIDKWGIVNAVKLSSGGSVKRDEYIILLREITLGSINTNGVIIKGEGISDIHARILYRDGTYMIEDLNSLHGTFVNGLKIEPGTECALTENAAITIGDTEIGFELTGSGAQSPTV